MHAGLAWMHHTCAETQDKACPYEGLPSDAKPSLSEKVAQAREREQEEELEAVRRDAKAAAKAFNDVRQKRYDAFTAAFEHIASVIDPIFKDLTRGRCALSFRRL